MGGATGSADAERDDQHGRKLDESDASARPRAVAAAAIGNTMEWFDFGVYS